ncbi:hypothetical protein N9B08_01750 [Akkermansiaceae bacterium]|nr:hypothetical protein [Akkermansiaceae bacterium]MDA7875363.1 hypothetical protein [Akkermansiaceae bacterium]
MKLRSNCSSAHWLRFFGTALAAFSAAGVARGQEGAARLPELPSGFYEAAATVIGEGEDPSFGKLDFELGLLSRYDSNVPLGAPEGRFDEESDFLIQPSLKSSFQLGSGSGEWRFGLKGQVTRMNFNELGRFNATNYSFGLNGGYQSTRAKLLFDTAYASRGGVNRFVGSFFEQTSVSLRLTGDYTISPKTSFELSVKQSSVGSETAGFADTSSTTFRAAALWKATPLIRLGPGFRYGVRTAETGASIQERELTVTGPVLRLDYKLSTKVSFTSNVGLGFASIASRDDELLNWQLGLKYRASSLWGLNLEMIRATQAALVAGGSFAQVSRYRFGYTRKIRRARLNLGVSYEDRELLGPTQVVSDFRESGYLTYTASLGLPVYGDQVDLSLNLAWRVFDSADTLRSWKGLQSGLSLAYSF